eukprot:12929297-Prorocentrum_lima.AAC.1
MVINGWGGSRGLALWQIMPFVDLSAAYRYQLPHVGPCQNADPSPPFLFTRNHSRSVWGILSQPLLHTQRTAHNCCNRWGTWLTMIAFGTGPPDIGMNE